MRRAAAFAGVLLLAAAAIAAGEPVIVRITVHRSNIFDPAVAAESSWPYRATNALHIVTQEAFIRRELLFREGDPCDPAVLQESERKLRATGLMNPVSVTTTLLPGGGCAVDVYTRDSWTTKPGIDLARYGGETTYSIALEESNFLGWGTELLLSYDKEVDDRRFRVDYRDPQFLGRSWDAWAAVWDTDEGNGFSLRWSQPFDAFTVPVAWEALVRRDETAETLYWGGDRVYRTVGDHRYWRAWYGERAWERDDGLLRLSAGFTREELRYEAGETLEPGHPFADSPPLELSTLWTRVEFLRVRYLKTKGVVGWTSDEDIFLGPRLRVETGWSLPLLEGDEAWSFAFLYQDGAARGPWLWQRRAGGSLLRTGDGWRNNSFYLDSNLFLRTSGRSDLTLAASLDGYGAPDLRGVVYLGAEEGQRGFGYRIDTGSRRLRVTLQEKVMLFENVLALGNLGLAAFYDGAMAWGWGRRFGEAPWLHCAGVGLRFENLRSKVARVARLDIGYAFSNEEQGWQVTLATGDWFVFNPYGHFTVGY
jgi:hypothetical protein